MTLVQNPTDLPTSLEAMANSSIKVLATNDGKSLLQNYIHSIDHFHDSQKTSLYSVASMILDKLWRVHQFFGIINNLKVTHNNTIQACDTDNHANRKYIFSNGPSDLHFTSVSLTSKLLVKATYRSLKIFENTEVPLFQTGNFVTSSSDNFLKHNFEKYLSYLVQSGINLVQIRYLKEYYMEYYIQVVHGSRGINADSRNILYYKSVWLQNQCFSLYREDVCDLNTDRNLDIPVKITDLLTVYILYVVLLVISVFELARECARERFFKRLKTNITVY